VASTVVAVVEEADEPHALSISEAVSNVVAVIAMFFLFIFLSFIVIECIYLTKRFCFRWAYYISESLNYAETKK
jgi:hypothetical protein